MTTIHDVREIIAKRAVDHIRECILEDITQHLVIQSFTGSGKSVSVMQAIDKAGYTWMYFAPFHDIIRENIEYSKLWNYDFTHMKGKNQQGVCNVPEYLEYAKQGINITPFCETRCPLRHDGCTYYETKDKIESFPLSWAGVHSHIPTYLQRFLYDKEYEGRAMFNYYDVMIIDEFPTQCLYNQTIISKKDVDDLRNVLTFMTDSDEKAFVNLILDELIKSTELIKINHRKIKYLINERRSYDLDKLYEEYEKTLLSLISNDIIKKPPKPILFNINLIYKQNPTRRVLEWMLYTHEWDHWNRGGIYITTSNIDYFKDMPVPVVALDATADIKAWNTLLNDNCYHKQIDMEYKNLYQLRSAGRYPVSTWISIKDSKQVISETGKRLCDLIIHICNNKNFTVLLCSNKKIRDTIQKYLDENYKGDNYRFAIYYNLRSRNEYYADCDTCIITHEPNIPLIQSEIIYNVLNWDANLLRKLMTSSEIKQGIGRIRQNILMTPEGRIRENIETYVLPGARDDNDIQYKVVDEAKLITYEDMMHDNLNDFKDIIKVLIKKAGTTSISALQKATGWQPKTIKSELKQLVPEYIDSWKYPINWVFDEDKAKQTNYKVLN